MTAISRIASLVSASPRHERSRLPAAGRQPGGGIRWPGRACEAATKRPGARGLLTVAALVLVASFALAPRPAAAVLGERWTYDTLGHETEGVAVDRTYEAAVRAPGKVFGFQCRYQEQPAGTVITAAPLMFYLTTEALEIDGAVIRDGETYDVLLVVDDDRFTLPMTARVREERRLLQIPLDFSQQPVALLLGALRKGNTAVFNGEEWTLRGSSRALSQLAEDCE